MDKKKHPSTKIKKTNKKKTDVLEIPKNVQPQLLTLTSQLNNIQNTINTICATIISCNGLDSKTKYQLSQDCKILTKLKGK